MWNFQGIILTWTRAYRQIFKSALVYLNRHNCQSWDIEKILQIYFGYFEQD